MTPWILITLLAVVLVNLGKLDRFFSWFGIYREGLFDEASFCSFVKTGDLGSVNQYLKAGISPNARCQKTPVLSVAIQQNHHKIAKLLIEKGADVNAKDSWGNTALMWASGSASQKADLEIIDELIRHGADVNAKNDAGNTALRQAPRYSLQNEVIFRLLQAGANPSIGASDTFDVLTRMTDPRMAEEYIKGGADLNIRNSYGQTPLMVSRNPAAIRRLIEAGADLNARDSSGKSVLLYLCQSGSTAAVQLAESGRINLDDPPAYFWACGMGNLGLLEQFHRSGMRPNIKDAYGNTPLIVAVQKGRKDIVNALLQAGAELNETGPYAGSPLTIAKELGHTEIAEILKARGAKEIAAPVPHEQEGEYHGHEE